MWRNLKDRVILVTGASRGIGKCVVERLAEYKPRLVLAARSRESLVELADQLAKQGVEALPVAVDLMSPDGRAELVSTIRDRYGRLDVLINNAGVASFGEFATSTEDVLRHIMEINFFTPVELTRQCLPLLQEAQRLDPKTKPVLLNVSSICGRRGLPSYPEHSASKFALLGMTEAIRAEFVRFDIDVVLVLPGLTRTDDLNSHLLRNEGQIHLDHDSAQSANHVAGGIVSALLRTKREAVVGLLARWIWRGEQFFPRLMDWIMARKVRNYQKRAQK